MFRCGATESGTGGASAINRRAKREFEWLQSLGLDALTEAPWR